MKRNTFHIQDKILREIESIKRDEEYSQDSLSDAILKNQGPLRDYYQDRIHYLDQKRSLLQQLLAWLEIDIDDLKNGKLVVEKTRNEEL